MSALGEKVQVNPLFLGNLVPLRAMDLASRYCMLVLASSENPLEVWGAFAASWITAFGKPVCLQMEGGGEWDNVVCADLCSERNIRLQLPSKGAHPCMSGGRNGLVRAIYNRCREDGRFAGKASLDEI